jgi:hypothetical protein
MFHPPAAINPPPVISNNLSWSLLSAPVLAGAVLLPASAYVASMDLPAAVAAALVVMRARKARWS